ncbi:DNA cytosine methyltransferase [Bacillus cereus group sp. MYBK245-1]|uniref:DNA cytosine methyltransferase n=2 Tax=unclassified Bacillus cereus group TaxID=2750818 RepID=UPI003F79294C
MMQNGKLSPQPSAEFLKIEQDYSLSHILEDETPDEYLVDLDRVKDCVIGICEGKVFVREATKKGYNIAYHGDTVNLTFPTSKTRRGRVGKGIAQTLLTSREQAVLTNDDKLRWLTERESWRLQGIPDSYFEKAAAVTSKNQLYKQAGNGVTVDVVYEIAKRL